MKSITATLALHCDTFSLICADLVKGKNPAKIVLTNLEAMADRMKGKIQFAEDLEALNEDSADELRSHVNNIVNNIDALRRTARATNYICGQQRAINSQRRECQANLRKFGKAYGDLKNTGSCAPTWKGTVNEAN
ncbi:hypothetical protein UFOVP824_26 [uncultured Caudovirales phage]|uniref:Uncharacterized protein n=1 Tax=uncultured Caudovirales phage TaxID=2100421 RepID=A0A6J5PBW1_9CAUD|nr:hypothetical protein UFOVP824_26 [uncultured Caudovirales phage]